MLSNTRTHTFIAALIFVLIAGVVFLGAQEKVQPRGGTSELRPALQPKTATPPPSAPITFADADGQELILEELSARTAIHGMLSLTELELRFRNPQSRRIEGRFTCTLPPNAAISRFAKEINGQLMEGEVVERLRANQVYEQFLHQMRDPALLEQDQGNRFSARIFPIDANARVRLLVSYTTLLPMKEGVRTYSLPLRGLPKIGKFTFRGFVTPVAGEGEPGKLTTSAAQVTTLDQHDWTPDQDIVMNWQPQPDAPRARILRAGDFYLASWRMDGAAGQRGNSAPRSWIFYVDTSASAAEGAPHRIRALEELIGSLPAREAVQVIAFDQELTVLSRGTASEVARTLGDKLRSRLFLGGTDLGGVLRDIGKRLEADGSPTVVIASDLVATLGDVASHDLNGAMASIPANATVHALILGSREDSATVAAVTRGRGRTVRIGFTENLAARARAAAEELRRPMGITLEVHDPSAEWIYPARFEDVQPGDEVLTLAKVRPGAEPAPAFSNLPESRLDSATATRLDSATFAPLLEREAYRAYLQYLAEREAGESAEAVRRALATEQVKVSIEQRVVIPRTTMLVLESEADYQRFGLDRRALAAILTIDAGGIGRVDRARTPEIVAEVVPPPLPGPRPGPLPRPEPLPQRKTQAAPSAGARMNEGVTVTAQAPALDRMATAEADVASRDDASFVVDAVEETAVLEGARNEAGIAAPRSLPAPPPPPATGSVAESITVPREESRRGGGERARRQTSPDWTKSSRPVRSRITELEKQLAANPADRESYNQLGEALAAWEEWSAVRALALRWQPYDPENPQVYELLGLADERMGNENEAARAYASLIEIAPAKTELLQRAGLLLMGVHRANLAETPLRRALEARPDRVNGYRHLALMLWSEGRHEEAARVLESATRQQFPNWYLDVQRIVREELGYVYRAWMSKDPSRRNEIVARAREYAVDLDRRDALRVTLAWETDANDVDLHVVDPAGEEAFYSHPRTASGLELYSDVTQGLGPEVIRTSKTEAGTYHVGVRYFAAGPMGISRGVVIVLRGDTVGVHPFRLVQGGEEIRYVTAVRLKG